MVVAVEVRRRDFRVVDEADDAASDHHEEADDDENYRANQDWLQVVWMPESACNLVCVRAVI